MALVFVSSSVLSSPQACSGMLEEVGIEYELRFVDLHVRRPTRHPRSLL